MTMGSTPSAGGGGGTAGQDARDRAAQDAEQLKAQGRAAAGAASQAKDAAKDSVSRGASQARDAATQAASQAKDQAYQAAQHVRERGASALNEQKSRAADQLGDVGAALRRAGEKLHEEHDDNLAGYADALASRAESCADYLRQRDANQLVHDVADLSRRRPEWVLGGAFVAGLALARFLKASRPDGAAYGSYRRWMPGRDASDRGFGSSAGDSSADYGMNESDESRYGGPLRLSTDAGADRLPGHDLGRTDTGPDVTTTSTTTTAAVGIVCDTPDHPSATGPAAGSKPGADQPARPTGQNPEVR